MNREILSNLVDLTKGKKADYTDEPGKESSKRFIQIDDLRNNNNLKYTDNKGVEVKDVDVVIAWDGANAGTVGCGLSGIIGSTLTRIRLKHTDLSPQYLGYFLKSKSAYLRGNSTGATIPHLSKEILLSLQIPLPPLPEQQAIAARLGRVEQAIQKRKQSLALLDEYVKSTFLEMFGDPVKNEKGWEVARLGNLGTLERGVSKHRPRNAPELVNGPYPLIQTGDVANSLLFITEYKNTYSEVGLRQSKLWPKDTLCITIAANIAKTSILTFDACFPDSVVGFQSFKNKTNNFYVHYLFSFLQRILEESAPQAAQKNINLDILRNLLVPVPRLSVQKKYEELVRKYFVTSSRLNDHAFQLETLYQSLMSEAFG